MCRYDFETEIKKEKQIKEDMEGVLSFLGVLIFLLTTLLYLISKAVK